MSRVEIAQEVAEDFDRILVHLVSYNADKQVDQTPAILRKIVQAFDLLETSPLVGRPVGTLQQLIIGRGSRGYVALYRYVAEVDTVFVLAIRSQQEAGYQRSE